MPLMSSRSRTPVPGIMGVMTLMILAIASTLVLALLAVFSDTSN